MDDVKKEEIFDRARYLASLDSDQIDKIRDISCKFFAEGKRPACTYHCMGCGDEDKVLECRDFYLSRIFTHPLEVWDESFEHDNVRKKRSIDGLSSIGLSCNSCYMSDKCPLYERNASCGIDWGDDDPENLNSKQILDMLIAIQRTRVKKASVFEQLDGGMPDMNLSSEMDRLDRLANSRRNLDINRQSLTIHAESNSDTGGSVLQKLFAPKEKAIEEPKETNKLPDINTAEDIVYVEVPKETTKKSSGRARKQAD